MKCPCGARMIVIDSRPMDDGRIFRRRHCFRCSQEAIGIEKISLSAKRPHPRAFSKVYRPQGQASLEL